MSTNHGPNTVPWQDMEDEYIINKMTYNELSKKYRVALRAIEKYGSNNNWVQKKEEYNEQKSVMAREECIHDFVNSIIEVKNNELSSYGLVEKAIWSLISYEDKDGNRILNSEISSVEMATFIQSFERLQKMRYKTLGIDSGFDLSKINSILIPQDEGKINIREMVISKNQIEEVTKILIDSGVININEYVIQ